MKIGCSICENNYSKKLKYAIGMSVFVIRNTLLKQKGNKEKRTLHHLTSSLRYKEKLIKEENNLRAKDYISFFVEFILRYEETEDHIL